MVLCLLLGVPASLAFLCFEAWLCCLLSVAERLRGVIRVSGMFLGRDRGDGDGWHAEIRYCIVRFGCLRNGATHIAGYQRVAYSFLGSAFLHHFCRHQQTILHTWSAVLQFLPSECTGVRFRCTGVVHPVCSRNN